MPGKRGQSNASIEIRPAILSQKTRFEALKRKQPISKPSKGVGLIKKVPAGTSAVISSQPSAPDECFSPVCLGFRRRKAPSQSPT